MMDISTQLRNSFAEIDALHDIDKDTRGTEDQLYIGAGEQYYTCCAKYSRNKSILSIYGQETVSADDCQGLQWHAQI